MIKKHMIIVLVFIIFLTGCDYYKGKIHEENEFIEYINNLKMEFGYGNDRHTINSNLKNKYQILSDDIRYDEDGKKERIIYLKINNENLIFYIKSSYECSSFFSSGNCLEETYTLTDNFSDASFKYYINKYNKIINNTQKLCYNSLGCDNHRLYIKSYNDLLYLKDYLNNFLNYVNNIDLNFINHNLFFVIYFDDGIKEEYFVLHFDYNYNENKYIYNLNNNYTSEGNNIESYIDNFLIKNNINLK